MFFQANYAEQKNAYTNYNDNEAEQRHTVRNAFSLVKLWMAVIITDECSDCWLPFS